VISYSDLIIIALAYAIGYIDDVTGPQKYHHQGVIVEVNEKYQCPTYCGIIHCHSVYYEDESTGMVVAEDELGDRYKEPKRKRRR
jgi:hypothetical protein